MSILHPSPDILVDGTILSHDDILNITLRLLDSGLSLARVRLLDTGLSLARAVGVATVSGVACVVTVASVACVATLASVACVVTVASVVFLLSL